jgi:hypothetical protein
MTMLQCAMLQGVSLLTLHACEGKTVEEEARTLMTDVLEDEGYLR